MQTTDQLTAQSLVDKIKTPALQMACLLENNIKPLIELWMRLWMANIFFNSGLVKIADWQATVLLFEYEYQVPFLPAELAAFGATVTELSVPILLALGLFTRLASIPVLIMAVVIELTVFQLPQHYFWMMVFAYLIANGPGKWSLDHLIRTKLFR